jgi:hypothetical protein
MGYLSRWRFMDEGPAAAAGFHLRDGRHADTGSTSSSTTYVHGVRFLSMPSYISLLSQSLEQVRRYRNPDSRERGGTVWSAFFPYPSTPALPPRLKNSEPAILGPNQGPPVEHADVIEFGKLDFHEDLDADRRSSRAQDLKSRLAG